MISNLTKHVSVFLTQNQSLGKLNSTSNQLAHPFLPVMHLLQNPLSNTLLMTKAITIFGFPLPQKGGGGDLLVQIHTCLYRIFISHPFILMLSQSQTTILDSETLSHLSSICNDSTSCPPLQKEKQFPFIPFPSSTGAVRDFTTCSGQQESPM